MTLLGAPRGVEDQLQELVPEAIDYMIKAGLKVIVLTGDKKETAVTISKQSGAGAGPLRPTLHAGDDQGGRPRRPAWTRRSRSGGGYRRKRSLSRSLWPSMVCVWRSA